MGNRIDKQEGAPQNDLEMYEKLLNMGYSEETSLLASKKYPTHIVSAIDWIDNRQRNIAQMKKKVNGQNHITESKVVNNKQQNKSIKNENEEKHDLNDRNTEFEEIDISNYRTWDKAPEIKDFECPICLKIMRNPVKLNNISAHTFCKECIEKWLQNHRKNPLTGQKIQGCCTLNHYDELRKEIEALFFDCIQAKQEMTIIKKRPYDRDGYKFKPETAKVAEKFYEENLKHLEPEFYARPWVREQLERFGNRPYPSNDDNSKDQSLKEIDEMEKEMHQTISDRCQSARDEIKQTDPDDVDMRQQIQQELEQDISCFERMVHAICDFLRRICDKITLGFEMMREFIRWLFGWNEDNNDDVEL